MSGRGTLRTSDGLHGAALYEGTFLNGKLSGQGRVRFGWDGEEATYEGGWREGQRDGHGTCRGGMGEHGGGAVYVGQWRADRRHGEGTLSTEAGRIVYRGVWRDGRPAGWNYYRARRCLGWCIVRIAFPLVFGAVGVGGVAVLLAVLTATPTS